MTTKERELPRFSKPPVVETVLGVTFQPPDAWDIPVYGLFWNEIRSDFPRYEVQPPIMDPIRLGDGPTTIRFTSKPNIRCWFIDETDSRLIQVQRDRFFHNWRKRGEGNYPHYHNIKPNFVSYWEKFNVFLLAQGIGPAPVRQCEITYINHFEKGIGWEDFGDLARLLRCWPKAQPGGILPAPDDGGMNLRYPLPDDRGHLFLKLETAIRHQDAKEVVQLTLSARGKPASEALQDVLEWFDLGHFWVVSGFEALTTDEMHSIWGKE